MSDLGAGLCGFGSAGAGYGSPGVTTSATSTIFVQVDGSQGDCAYIDPVSRDYILDERGNKRGWDSIRQKVYLALRTVLGSSCIVDQGVAFPRGVLSPNIAIQNKNAVNAALKPLTDLNLIQVVQVLTKRVGQSGVQIQIDWKIVSTGQIVSEFV